MVAVWVALVAGLADLERRAESCMSRCRLPTARKSTGDTLRPECRPRGSWAGRSHTPSSPLPQRHGVHSRQLRRAAPRSRPGTSRAHLQARRRTTLRVSPDPCRRRYIDRWPPRGPRLAGAHRTASRPERWCPSRPRGRRRLFGCRGLVTCGDAYRDKSVLWAYRYCERSTEGTL